MSQLSLPDLIVSCRRVVGDTGSARSSTIRDEQLGGVDGTNKRFKLLYFPVVTGSAEVRKNGVLQTIVTHYTIDETNGVVSFVTPPSGTAPKDVIEATYRFLWYADDEYKDFIAAAAVTCDYIPVGSDIPTQATDVAARFPDGLLDAFRAFVGYHFNIRRADEYAYRFGSSAGGQTVNVDVVTKNFREMADRFMKDGTSLRDSFYTRRGKRASPSAGVSAFGPVPSVSGPYGTPRR